MVHLAMVNNDLVEKCELIENDITHKKQGMEQITSAQVKIQSMR